MADQVPALWGEIVTWLRTHVPADAGRLRPPAPASLISEVEAAVGRPLPEELRQWWQQADGAVPIVDLLPSGFTPISCREALANRAGRLEIAESLLEEDDDDDDDDDWEDDEEEPEFVGFHPHYLPIGDNHCGDCLYVDLRDGPDYGSVKYFNHEDYYGNSVVHWRGITEMLTDIRDALLGHDPSLSSEWPSGATGRNYRATVSPSRELGWVPADKAPPRRPAPAEPNDRGYDEILRRYRDLLTGPHAGTTGAMSWTVITGQTDLASIIRRLGGDPDTVQRHRPIGDDRRQPRWYLDETDGTVTLLEVNGSQAGRPVVLRLLSRRSNQVFGAYWTAEGDNAFSYAASDEVVTQFDGRDPARREGSEPAALEAGQEPLWAAAGGSWQAAMLALTEVRTGVRLDAAWLEQPHPVLIAEPIPDGPSATTLKAEVFARLMDRENPRRHTAFAWLIQTLAEDFDLGDPALLRAIEAHRAGTPIDEETARAIRDMTGELAVRARARDESVPQHRDPVWLRGQAASAASGVLGVHDMWIFLLHAENAFADDWHRVVRELRARL
ncbi:SMI1/KNR4 family protein [Actinoplanes subglobosus]|uniref:SMI1/KNR4 family protein n=1 Tax=Actinoplanes subglobosus TaxID=1547892 RepID=A0ABV8J2S0_9ACTN